MLQIVEETYGPHHSFRVLKYVPNDAETIEEMAESYETGCHVARLRELFPVCPQGFLNFTDKGFAINRKPADSTQYHDHLLGKLRLGLSPFVSKDEVRWGALDIDKRDTDAPIDVFELAKRLAHKPVVVCRSKTGGAHVFVFVKKAVKADAMLKVLSDIAGQLPMPCIDRFPRNSVVAVDGWTPALLLPYFNGDGTHTYGATADGKALSLGAFLTLAEAQQQNAAKLFEKQRPEPLFHRPAVTSRAPEQQMDLTYQFYEQVVAFEEKHGVCVKTFKRTGDVVDILVVFPEK